MGKLHNLKKVKHVRWLIPGWAYYQYYKTHKNKGGSKKGAVASGVKAEAVRIVAAVSFPVPGTYELSTIGLAVLNKKIKKNEIEFFTLKDVKNNIPILKIKSKIRRKPYKKNKIILGKIKAKEVFNKYTKRRLRKFKIKY